ncbi:MULTISPECIES: hypothetical protein [unclassified Brucella]|uniref:hypothetical protein n=1 Tax=unclassified Brucella TaxID=2632610 RepID=UPI0012AE690B|nr:MULTISPECIES: hypothetical protein [unclassified Brucella]MRN79450.1 hypothetical protein [Brucella sp. 10RB9210]UWF59815.1 hypothetical protein NYO66_04700 [Brucella sp. 2716]
MKTDKSALEKLFDAFADELKGQLAGDEPVPAATLNVIRQFLKDQNVNTVPGQNDKLNEIANSLPFNGQEHTGDDDEYTTTH